MKFKDIKQFKEFIWGFWDKEVSIKLTNKRELKGEITSMRVESPYEMGFKPKYEKEEHIDIATITKFKIHESDFRYSIWRRVKFKAVEI